MGFVNHQETEPVDYFVCGGENGWIDGAALVFQIKTATGNYHDEMPTFHFEE